MLAHTLCFGLTSEDPEIARRSREATVALHASRGNSGLWDLDALCRMMTSLEWFREWEEVDPHLACAEEPDENRKAVILGHFSFHPNGFLREKAVVALAELRVPHAIPYLLIRLNDWVGPVRAKAVAAIEARLAVGSAPDFLPMIPLLTRLARAVRSDHAPIIARIQALVATDTGALRAAFTSEDARIRRFALEAASKCGSFPASEMRAAVAAEKDPVSRLLAVRVLTVQDLGMEGLPFLERLLEDRFAPIQRRALYLLGKGFPERAAVAALEFLHSPNLAVRLLARRLIVGQGGIQIADRYRHALSGAVGSSLCGSLHGLGETGEPADSALILPYLAHSDSRAKRAALSALATLAPGMAVEKALEFLEDPHPGMSRAAADLLKRCGLPLDWEGLGRRASGSSLVHARRNIGRVLLAAPIWVALPFILGFLKDREEGMQGMASQALGKWIQESSRYFVPATMDQKAKARESFSRCKQSIPEKERELLAFILR